MNVSAGRFFPARTNRYAYFSTYHGQGFWSQAGVGFVGFEFNNGGGKQYGWARVRTRGPPSYAFVVEDYAWGDPGDAILAGQTESEPAAQVPASGSLGMLALGGAGIAAWRRARSRDTFR